MPLDHEQLLALQLAGTVALPSPPPATGSVEIDLGINPSVIYLRIIHRVNPKLTIIRSVSLENVRVICTKWEADAPAGAAGRPPASASWACKTIAEFRPLLEQRIAAGSGSRVPFPWLQNAVVYVSEQAPVLMQVDVGLTAAESAEYYPPLAPGFADEYQCEKCRPKKTST